MPNRSRKTRIMAALRFFHSGGMPDASSKKLRKLTLIEGDAGCALQSRFFFLTGRVQ
jgi:hypothetical protein